MRVPQLRSNVINTHLIRSSLRIPQIRSNAINTTSFTRRCRFLVARRRRLNALQSVDDLIDEFATTLEDLGELDNTYIIYTSDNGYHLGQFGIPIDKRQAYESDVRVPLIVKGPGVQQNVTIDASYALNIDLAPTIMAMAGATEDQIASIGFEGKPILGLLQTGETEVRAEKAHLRDNLATIS